MCVCVRVPARPFQENLAVCAGVPVCFLFELSALYPSIKYLFLFLPSRIGLVVGAHTESNLPHLVGELVK